MNTCPDQIDFLGNSDDVRASHSQIFSDAPCVHQQCLFSVMNNNKNTIVSSGSRGKNSNFVNKNPEERETYDWLRHLSLDRVVQMIIARLGVLD